jgi:hypothetical protein
VAVTIDRALARFIAETHYIVAVHDLTTKWRIELRDDYLIDVYFNESLGKYGYSLILADKRIVGWDNAPHHPEIDQFPHHVHYADGRIEPSELNGDPEHDLLVVSRVLNAILDVDSIT